MNMRVSQRPHWPYPTRIAHRGAGKLAPENTLAAFRLGAQCGYRMFECDVKLSADGVPFFLHDDDLARTTNAEKKVLNTAFAHIPPAQAATDSIATSPKLQANHWPWTALSQLDAGSWHSRAFAGEPLPTLDNVAAFCLQNGYFLNLEIKPSPGTERHTGEVVAQQAARLWKDAAVPPLLTSFAVPALEGARDAQPELPRGLLLERLWTGWLEAAVALDCQAVVCHYSLWDASSVTLAKNAGFRCLSYTVNDEAAAQRMGDLGTDGFITDRVDLFSPAGP
jgi:glycerophosphoryl diester phosphodiesterase